MRGRGRARVLATYVVVAVACNSSGSSGPADSGTVDSLRRGCTAACCAGVRVDPACVETCVSTAQSKGCVDRLESLAVCAYEKVCCELGAGTCSTDLARVSECMNGTAPDTGVADTRETGGCGVGIEVPVVCSNKLDDDCDGLIDCADPDCASIVACGGGKPDAGPPDGGSSGTCPSEPKPVWITSFPAEGNQLVITSAVGPAGELFITGRNTGKVDFGGGVLDAKGGNGFFIVKFDAAGKHVWSKQFDAPGEISARGLAVDASGRLFFAGSVTGATDFGAGPSAPVQKDTLPEIFVLALDEVGAFRWVQRYGFGEGYAIALHPDGGVVATGFYAQSNTFGDRTLTSAGERDIFVLHLDATGKQVAVTSIGDKDLDIAYGVAVAPDGSAIVSGTQRDKFEVYRLGKSLEKVWAYEDIGSAYTITFTPEGGSVVTSSIWHKGLDANGARLWSSAKSRGGIFPTAPPSLDGKGGAWIAGDVETHPAGCAFGTDVRGMLVRLDYGTCGAPTIVRTYKAPKDAIVNVWSVALTAEGELVTAGSIKGSDVDLGAGVIAPTLDYDAFIARYAP